MVCIVLFIFLVDDGGNEVNKWYSRSVFCEIECSILECIKNNCGECFGKIDGVGEVGDWGGVFVV